MTRKRLPRNRRVAPDERPPFRWQPRDFEVLRAVNDCQVLLTRQIETLLFNGKQSPTQRRLSRLYQYGFLERHAIVNVTPAPASALTVYTLTKQGGQVLIDRFGYEHGQMHISTKEGLSWKFLDHLLLINDVRIAVTVCAQQQGFNLIEWRDEPVFRAHPDIVQVGEKTGKAAMKPVLPDGFFALRVPQGTARFFLELDRGTEPHHKFKPQIQVYDAYIQSGQYEKRYQAKGIRVLVITTTPLRLKNLKTVTAQVVGEHKNYWFTTFNEIKPETVLTAPIWQRLDNATRYPLIET